MAKAKVAALKAVEMDDNLSEGHSALAQVLWFYELDWPEAEREFELAIELNPGNAWSRWAYGLILAWRGRLDDAIAQMERAHELDPLAVSPARWDLGSLYARNGEDERALAQWARTLELAPNYHATHQHIGNFHCQKGATDQGIAALNRARALSPADPHIAADLAYCHVRAGQTEEAEEILAELEERAESGYVSPMALALTLVGLGENERAIELLERAYETRANMVGSLGVDARYAPLRSDPRFQDILRGIGFLES
jgi:serine/threonine-protein kinase